jgi:hypothetical protein
MTISSEDMRRIAEEMYGPTMRSARTPEECARSDEILAWLADLEAKGRPRATEEQTAIWQAWGDSELRRIDRETGNDPE